MNRLKIWIGIALVFVLGAASGSLGTQVYYKHRISQVRQAGPRVELYSNRLCRYLDLNQAQEYEIRAIINDSAIKIDDVRTRVRPEIREINDETFDRIRQVLDEEQIRKLDMLHEDMNRHMGPRWHHRHPRHHGRHPGRTGG